MKLHLIRHCESEGNVLRRFISLAHHHPLTERGRHQADGLRILLAGVAAKPGIIWHSPALRTRQTAEVLRGKKSPRTLQMSEHLREVEVGTLEGRSEDEASAMSIFHETVTRWSKGELAAGFEGGESLADVLERANAVREVLLEDPSEEAIVVSHCLFLCGLIPVLTGRQAVDYQGSYVTKGAWNLLEGKPGEMRVQKLNDVAHQPEEHRSEGGPYSP